MILEFIESQSLMVVATIDPDGKPEAAVVGFGQTDSLELIFGTDDFSRKYHNLQQRPTVAVVIGGEGGKTVQLEGVAEVLGREDKQLVQETYWRKSPRAASFDANASQRYLKITPNWLRYTDLKQKPPEIIELKF
jgi:pyridoxine/pyridoxamine 5'-phosphate oxidase